MYNSRKYQYLPHRREFFLRPPLTPLEIPIKLHTIFLNFWVLKTPHPQEIPIPSVRGELISSEIQLLSPVKTRVWYRTHECSRYDISKLSFYR